MYLIEFVNELYIELYLSKFYELRSSLVLPNDLCNYIKQHIKFISTLVRSNTEVFHIVERITSFHAVSSLNVILKNLKLKEQDLSFLHFWKTIHHIILPR